MSTSRPQSLNSWRKSLTYKWNQFVRSRAGCIDIDHEASRPEILERLLLRKPTVQVNGDRIQGEDTPSDIFQYYKNVHLLNEPDSYSYTEILRGRHKNSQHSES